MSFGLVIRGRGRRRGDEQFGKIKTKRGNATRFDHHGAGAVLLDKSLDLINHEICLVSGRRYSVSGERMKSPPFCMVKWCTTSSDQISLRLRQNAAKHHLHGHLFSSVGWLDLAKPFRPLVEKRF